MLASIAAADAPEVLDVVGEARLRRAADAKAQVRGLPAMESASRMRFQEWYEAEVARSVSRYFGTATLEIVAPLPKGIVYRRNPSLRGTAEAFGYDYLTDRLGRARIESLALLKFEGLRGGGHDYAYEALNFANGSRSTKDIRDALSAIYGPVPQQHVDAFLAAAAEAGLLLRSGSP